MIRPYCFISPEVGAGLAFIGARARPTPSSQLVHFSCNRRTVRWNRTRMASLEGSWHALIE